MKGIGELNIFIISKKSFLKEIIKSGTKIDKTLNIETTMTEA